MYVEKFNNNGIDYLRLVQSFRKSNQKGVMTCAKQVLLNIGPLDRFDDGYPDYLDRLKRSFREGTPLIAALEPFCVSEKSKETYRFSINEGSAECFGRSMLFSQLLFERILEELDLNNLFFACKSQDKIQYDLYGLVKLLVFGRLLDPASSFSLQRQNASYFIPMLDNYDLNHVSDALDAIYTYKNKITRRINTNFIKKTNRSLEIIYYAILPLHGGKSGDQVVLFIDQNGIPITAEFVSGSPVDCLTLQSEVKKKMKGTGGTHFILVANQDHWNCEKNYRLETDGIGYIMSGSLLKGEEMEQDWIHDDRGYVCIKDGFKYKSRIERKTIRDENGQTRIIEEKVIVCWSEKLQAYAERECEKLIGLLKEFRDFETVETYKNSLGYIRIITSEVSMDDREVIETYYQVNQMENRFYNMIGDPEIRPPYVRTRKHMAAYMLVCMLALIIQCVIQKKMDPENYWSDEQKGQRIQEALLKWRVDFLPGGFYRFMDMDDPDLKMILDSFDIKIPTKLYRRGELKTIKTQIRIFG